jgi:hypothetical protein
MKGYFSQLALSTGLKLERNSTSSSSAERPADAKLGGVPQKTAPMHVDAVSFTTSSQSPAAVAFEETPDAKALSPASLNSAEISAVNASFASADDLVTTANSASKSQSDVNDNKLERTSAPVSELSRQVSFEEVRTRTIDHDTTSGQFQPSSRSPAVAQRIVQSSAEPSLAASLIQLPEGPAPEKRTANLASPSPSQTTPDTIIELSSQTTAEEPRIRFTYSESSASLSETSAAELLAASATKSSAEHLTKRSAEHESQTIGFSAERSLVRPAPRGFLESIEEFESQLVEPASAPSTLTIQSDSASPLHQPLNQIRPRAEATQKPVRLPEASQRAEPNRDQRSERELIVLNYMKEVRAWVAAPPVIDETPPESVEWSEATPARRDVFVFEHEQESDVSAFPHHDRAAEPQVQDVSLSIGNISIVIEEPASNAPSPVATPPAAARSPELSMSEPTSLSRHYLSPW